MRNPLLFSHKSINYLSAGISSHTTENKSMYRSYTGRFLFTILRYRLTAGLTFSWLIRLFLRTVDLQLYIYAKRIDHNALRIRHKYFRNLRSRDCYKPHFLPFAELLHLQRICKHRLVDQPVLLL